jgi:mannose-1-phosphate guanylyltransferase/mannose-6-phosphate isomerase
VPHTSQLGPDVYAVILAGGSGTRFWPKSRHLRPKQLCRIGDPERTLLEVTLARLDGVIPPERRLIVTHADQAEATRKIVGTSVRSVLAEPEAKNTAAALALAAVELGGLATGKSAVMLSLHADHVVRDVPAFRRAIEASVAVARAGKLALLGVVPEYAETGYGYIERGDVLADGLPGHAVASFREKPERAVAEGYVATKRFLWNAGMFAWRLDTLEAELARTLPVTLTTLAAVAAEYPPHRGGLAACPPAELARAYKQLPKISIDHAVLETSTKAAVVSADIGWQDVGAWDALARAFGADADGNYVRGDACLLDATGTTVDSDGPFVAVLGAKDLCVVAAAGAVLVCPKDRAQEVKRIVDWRAAANRRELL